MPDLRDFQLKLGQDKHWQMIEVRQMLAFYAAGNNLMLPEEIAHEIAVHLHACDECRKVHAVSLNRAQMGANPYVAPAKTSSLSVL